MPGHQARQGEVTVTAQAGDMLNSGALFRGNSVPFTRIVVAMLLASAVIAPVPAHAGTLDGSHLLQMCNNVVKILSGEAIEDDVTDEMMFDAGVCIGMIVGISRTLIVLRESGEDVALACLPGKPLTNEQAARMILRHLEANRSRLDQPGAELALSAFREAFPCPRP